MDMSMGTLNLLNDAYTYSKQNIAMNCILGEQPFQPMQSTNGTLNLLNLFKSNNNIYNFIGLDALKDYFYVNSHIRIEELKNTFYVSEGSTQKFINYKLDLPYVKSKVLFFTDCYHYHSDKYTTKY
jgi:hypothetical protein